MSPDRSVSSFLVERYAVGGERDLAGTMPQTSDTVRHVISIVIESEETCLSLYEASSPTAVVDACRRAGLSQHRVIPVVVVGPELLL